MEHTAQGRSDRLYLGIELARKKWVIGLSDGDDTKVKEIQARNWKQFAKTIEWASNYFQLEPSFDIYSCYEAGQDGFDPHRTLGEKGVQNLVVDPGSIETDSKNKSAKTDRLDAQTLVRKLIHYLCGDREVFSAVRVPDPEDEDKRELAREVELLKKEKNQHRNRIRSLLFKHGIIREPSRQLINQLEEIETGCGNKLGEHLINRLRREWERLQFVREQLKETVTERDKLVKHQHEEDEKIAMVHQLMTLKGIGIETAFLFVTEAFGWREFRSREEIGGYWGLAPTPYNTGDSRREQGMSKDGPPNLRKMAVEAAWNWLRHQPGSELSEWFRDRWDGESKRMKKNFIVGLARKLMIRLWKFLENDVPPNGSKVGQQFVNWRML
jgi:transposase